MLISSVYAACGVATAALSAWGWYTHLSKSGASVEPVEQEVKPVSSHVISITDETFEAEAMKSDLPVILDAYADWSPPCKKMAPIFERLSGQMVGKVKFVKLNVDHCPKSVAALKVEAMPTLFLFKDGKKVDQHVGFAGGEEILSRCIKLL